MKPKVFAIAIDGPNIELLDQWLQSGSLPALRSVIQQGAFGRHFHTKRFRNERCWDILLSGRDTSSPGSTFNPVTYDYFNDSPQREQRYTPFYALGDKCRVCVFDLPAAISSEVSGFQITGWGSELNASAPLSSPASLIGEIQARHGLDPKLTQSVRVLDHKTREVENSYVIPNLYDPAALQDYKEKLLTSIARRTDIALDLHAREPWDLFLLNFCETHTANHLLWHLGESHPVSPGRPQSHALLEVFQAIDHAIGRLIAAMPDQATVVIYTIDHTTSNSMDVPSMAILPELLYRWNQPGQSLISAAQAGTRVPPLRTDYTKLWKHEIWDRVTEDGKKMLESPDALQAGGHPLSWHPAAWYRRLWPSMKAFALPSVSDGYVRINVKGREAAGSVDVHEYPGTLDSITEMLCSLINPRTGKAAVTEVHRIRATPFERPDIPPDLVVSWDPHGLVDCVDSAELGRVGPLPYFRTGGHVAHGSEIEGLIAARGPGVLSGTVARAGKLEDVPATILALLGAKPATEITGKSLL